ncbi:MAG TPA: ribosome maturation factor RimP [Dermatophilaceae bacterium]|nr:ribosome maturation factor RimP [Dermatophilaceae bacterium]
MRATHIRSIVEGPLAAAGFVVEDVTVSPAGKRSVVRVFVDRSLDAVAADDPSSRVAPLSLDEVADATRAVSDALDADSSTGSGPYVLEVSSPGVDRPLTERRHLRRNVGRLVRLTLADGSTAEGRISAVFPDTVVLTPADGAGAPREIAVDEVRSGRVVVEFGALPDEDDAAADDLDEVDALDGDEDLDDLDDLDDPDGLDDPEEDD